jgi:O-antigen ligase
MLPIESKPSFNRVLTMMALYCLAVSVSLGVALISISKLMIALAVLVRFYSMWRNGTLKWPFASGYFTFIAISTGLAWLYLTLLWSEGGDDERMVSFMRHARLLVVPAVYFLLDSKRDALKILLAVALGQLFVVCSSWLLWLGLSLPWAITDYKSSAGVLFTSTLEQPVMSTLMLILVWFLRTEIPQQWRTKFVISVLVLTITNVFFVMTGRTGYLVMLLAIALAVFWRLPKKLKPVALLIPVLITVVLGLVSTRFQTKITEINLDIFAYQQGNIQDTNSQGKRLDYWVKSLEAIKTKTFVGHGVGSWRSNYIQLGGLDRPDPPSNPHQQFLLWAVEGGLIGLALLLAIFAALYRDAGRLQTPAQQALKATLAISFLMSMMNCPFFGAGMGEFFFVMMGALLATKDRQLTQA